MVEMVKCKLNGKFEIILPKHRAERPEWYTDTGWEKKRLEHMYKTVSEHSFSYRQLRGGPHQADALPPVVFYVGAEEGDMCGLVASWGAQLLMFEPNDKVMPNIKAIWDANRLIPAKVYYGFASDITTDKDAFILTEDITGDVIHDHGFKELKDAVNLPQIRIDDIGIVPDIISLDVEGSEGKVLRGAEQVLRNHHPKIYLSLHPEFIHEQYGEWGAELRAWIISLGYKETLIDYPLHEVHLYYEAA